MGFLALAGLCVAFPAHAQMSLPGKFEVTDTGSASYTIPISLVSGTAGLEPKLSLQYDSRRGNGLLGVGWSLAGLPAITRCGRTIAQDGQVGGVSYDANDRFCLDGQRLVAISGTYGADGTEYRTERESFSKVVSYGQAGSGPSWFKVWTKAGLIMEFGNSADSRIEAQGKQSVRVWALNKTSDTKGNYFTVQYIEDNANGEYRPDRIDYTGNAVANTQPTSSVRFVYETRPDIVPLYQAGSLIRTTQRMAKVQAWQGSGMAREYRSVFESSPSTSRSRVHHIRQCDAQNNCLPEIEFTWQSKNLSFAGVASWSPSFGAGGGWNDFDYPRQLSDVNGDGKMDIIGFSGTSANVALSTGSGFAAPALWHNCYVKSCGWSNSDTYPRRVIDLNGDGRGDIIGFSGNGATVSLSNGTVFGTASIWTASFAQAAGWPSNSLNPRHMADVNGDGLLDIVGFSDSGIVVGVATGSGFATAQQWSSSFGRVESGYTDELVVPRMLADVNGDGLADVIGFASDGVYVALSTGSSFSAVQKWSIGYGTLSGWSNMKVYPRSLADVNGDGMADIVGFSGAGVNVSLSTGQGFLPAQIWHTGFGENTGWSNTDRYPRYVVDMNGDGFADIVGISSSGVVVALSTGVGFLPEVTWGVFFGEDAGWDGTYPRSLVDLNGDGLLDMLGFSESGVEVALSAGSMPDMVVSVKGAASQTAIGYGPLSDGSVGYSKDTGAAACAHPCVDLQGPLYVVSEVRSSNGLGGEYRSTYRYAGAKSDLHGRGFLGFRQMTVKDEQTGVEQVTTYRQDYPFTGLVASREKKLGAQLLNRSSNTYSSTSLGGTRRYPFLTQSLEESWELSGTALPAVTTAYQYDAWGNATQVSASTGDGHGKTTTNTYANDTAGWLLGRLQRSVVTSTTPGN